MIHTHILSDGPFRAQVTATELADVIEIRCVNIANASEVYLNLYVEWFRLVMHDYVHNSRPLRVFNPDKPDHFNYTTFNATQKENLARLLEKQS